MHGIARSYSHPMPALQTGFAWRARGSVKEQGLEFRAR